MLHSNLPTESHQGKSTGHFLLFSAVDHNLFFEKKKIRRRKLTIPYTRLTNYYIVVERLELPPELRELPLPLLLEHKVQLLQVLPFKEPPPVRQEHKGQRPLLLLFKGLLVLLLAHKEQLQPQRQLLYKVLLSRLPGLRHLLHQQDLRHLLPELLLHLV